MFLTAVSYSVSMQKPSRILLVLARFLFLVTLWVAPASADSFWQPLKWTTPDGVVLAGQYHASPNSEAMTWVLLHGLGSTGGEWDALAHRMAEQGLGVFVYDARGHGQSTQTRSGERLNYQHWRNAGPGTPWDSMSRDLAGAVQILVSQRHLQESRIAVGGASLGANVALVYASEHSAVPALLLLSPGLEYVGVQSPGPYVKFKGRPVFIAAAPGDAYSFASVRQLSMLAPSEKQRVEQADSGHGVQMLDDPFTKKLLGWMRSLGV